MPDFRMEGRYVPWQTVSTVIPPWQSSAGATVSTCVPVRFEARFLLVQSPSSSQIPVMDGAPRVVRPATVWLDEDA